MGTTSEAFVLLCARDESVAEAVEVSAAALGVPLRVEADSEEARRMWDLAALRLLSTEVAARWVSVAPGRTFIVGKDADDLARCSAGLGLPVLPLPDQSGRLAEELTASLRASHRRGATLALVGASGGLGVSTLAASLGLMAAGRGGPTAVVDLAEASSGIDLAVGLESTEGLRWPDLVHVRGEADDVLGGLPALDGAHFLSASRDDPQRPGQVAVDAVLASLSRSAGLVVVDAGRRLISGCDRQVLVVGADVRSVAAARVVAGLDSPDAIVVRRGPGRGLPAAVVAKSLGTECLGVIAEDKTLPRLAELGMSPVAAPARRYRAQVAALLGRLAHG